jgi:hypothetical protein
VLVRNNASSESIHTLVITTKNKELSILFKREVHIVNPSTQFHLNIEDVLGVHTAFMRTLGNLVLKEVP